MIKMKNNIALLAVAFLAAACATGVPTYTPPPAEGNARVKIHFQNHQTSNPVTDVLLYLDDSCQKPYKFSFADDPNKQEDKYFVVPANQDVVLRFSAENTESSVVTWGCDITVSMNLQANTDYLFLGKFVPSTSFHKNAYD